VLRPNNAQLVLPVGRFLTKICAMTETSFSILEERKDAELDPLLAFKWVCSELPGGLPVDYVESIDMPFPKIQPKDGLFGAGTYTYYPAFEDIDAFDLNLYEDSKMSTTKWLLLWFERIRDPEDGAYYLPTHYKCDLKFILMDTTGASVAEVTMLNCWPTGRGNWDLNYTSDDRLTIQQNFSCDAQKIELQA
jgi:hypothetical protein